MKKKVIFSALMVVCFILVIATSIADQEAGLEKDHIRTKELIKKGFKVLRLWEREVKILDLNKFENRLKNE